MLAGSKRETSGSDEPLRKRERLIPSRSLRLVGLCVVLGAEVAALWAVLPHMPPFFYLPLAPKASAWRLNASYDPAQDPPLGAALPFALSDLDTLASDGSSPSDGAAVILVIGDCSSCGVDVSLPWWRLCENAHVPLYLITSDTPDRVLRFLAEEGIRCIPVLDPDGALARALNAVWTPRAYTVDPDGVLVFAQEPDMADGAALDIGAAIMTEWKEEGR